MFCSNRSYWVLSIAHLHHDCHGPREGHIGFISPIAQSGSLHQIKSHIKIYVFYVYHTHIEWPPKINFYWMVLLNLYVHQEWKVRIVYKNKCWVIGFDRQSWGPQPWIIYGGHPVILIQSFTAIIFNILPEIMWAHFDYLSH